MSSKIAVLGAGAAGLGAAWKLAQDSKEVEVFEIENAVGGASKTMHVKGYAIDYGPHAFHIKKEEIVNFAKKMCNDSFGLQARNTRLIITGKNFEYPLRLEEALRKFNLLLSAKISIEYFLALMKNKLFPKPDDSFEAWGKKRFGNTLYIMFFGRYTERIWGIRATQLSEKLAQQKVANLNLKDVLLSLIGLKKSDKTYFKELAYPPAGIGIIYENMAAAIRKKKGVIHLNTKIKELRMKNGKIDEIVYNKDGKMYKLRCDAVVSSIPLKDLISLIKPRLDGRTIKDAKSLRYRDIRFVNIIVKRDKFTDAHWTYLLDTHFTCNRISEQKNLCKTLYPKGITVLTLERCCSVGDKYWDMPAKRLFNLAAKDLEKVGIKKEEIIDYFVLNLKDAYPVYDLKFDERVANVIKALDKISNLYSIGRQGLFLNNDMHDSIEMGFMAADSIAKKKTSGEWHKEIHEYLDAKLKGVGTQYQ